MNRIKQFIVKRIIKHEMKNLPKFSNFFKNNTPAIAQKIGDIAFMLAFIAGIPVGLASLPLAVPIAIPAIIVSISAYAATGLTIIKWGSKFFGVKIEIPEPTAQ
jgi:hypothetical protein